METTSNNTPAAWSPRIIEQLKNHISSDVVERFQTEWERVLCDMGFYMIPYSEEGIEQLKNVHFWQQIIMELSSAISLKQLATEVGIDEPFLQGLADGLSSSRCFISYQQGEKLLALHRENNLPRSEAESVIES